MSTNCLVTKIKGSVNNDNLPIFGKVKLLIEHVDNPTVDDKWFVLLAGSSPCKITFVNTAPIVGQYAGETEVTVPANTAFVQNIDLSGNNIAIIVDAYSMAGFQQKHVIDIVDYRSLKYGDFINGDYSGNNSDVKNKIAEIFNTRTGIKYLSNIPVSDETVVRNAATLISCRVTDPILIKDATNLLSCEIMMTGNIEYIPASIKNLGINNNVTGSVTALVNKFRAAGRTSGKIRVIWLTTNPYLTIDNGSGTEILVSEYVIAHGLPQQAESYLYWTADTMGITVDSTDAETFTASWFQAPFV